MWIFRSGMLKENADWKCILFSMKKNQYLLFIVWHDNRFEHLKKEMYFADELGKRVGRTAKFSNCIQELSANVLCYLLSVLNWQLFRWLIVDLEDPSLSKIIGRSVSITQESLKIVFAHELFCVNCLRLVLCCWYVLVQNKVLCEHTFVSWAQISLLT